MQLSIKDVAGGADTAAQGDSILKSLSLALKEGGIVTLDFSGVTTATSSFTNAAMVPLLSEYSFEHLREHLRVVKSTRQINDMIKSRLERASSGPAAA
jgi:hypothetical protein